MNAKEFYEQERLKGNTDHITSAPDPDYSLPFYQEIFDLMEAHASSKMLSQRSFLNYIRKERNSFVNAVNKQQWDNKFRTEMENFLLAYDQLVDQVKSLAKPTKKQ